MSARSSSESWGRASPPRSARPLRPGGGTRALDIINLDKFMRGAVRPSQPARRTDDACERLVVDAGGGGGGGGARKAASSSSSGSARDKRPSHDSGLSDGSYVRRRHREHRRVVGAGARGRRGTGGSNHSIRTFRAACEQALRDQQEQIARVAQICERLAVHSARAPPGPAPPPPPPQPRAPPPPRSDTPDSSELSSSSRSLSTPDQRRKDKHRTEECKTYKIIMSKLDELNRLFAARGAGGGGAGGGGAASRPRAPPPDALSVSVSDKLVATESVSRTRARVAHQTRRLVERATATGGSQCGRGEAGAGGTPRHSVLYTHELDTAPADALPGSTRRLNRLNVATKSAVRRSDSGSEWEDESATSARDPCCQFDLDDPVHLYAQAKRLQALHAMTRARRAASQPPDPAPGPKHVRARSVEMSARAACPGVAVGQRARRAAGGEAAGSLCAACCGYWRALRTCLAHSTLFCRPPDIPAPPHVPSHSIYSK